MAINPVTREPSQISDPATDAFLFSFSDTVDETNICRGFIPEDAGNAKVTTMDGSDVVLTGLLAGVLYPLRITRIWAASTTITGAAGVF